MAHYKDLIVWQKSILMVKRVYEITRDFPKEELYGLTSQIRRSSVSIPSNIAEGHGRRSNGDFARFLNIAMGSLFELETQLIIANQIGLLSADSHTEIAELINEIEAMLKSLIQKITS